MPEWTYVSQGPSPKTTLVKRRARSGPCGRTGCRHLGPLYEFAVEADLAPRALRQASGAFCSTGCYRQQHEPAVVKP